MSSKSVFVDSIGKCNVCQWFSFTQGCSILLHTAGRFLDILRVLVMPCLLIFIDVAQAIHILWLWWRQLRLLLLLLIHNHTLHCKTINSPLSWLDLLLFLNQCTFLYYRYVLLRKTNKLLQDNCLLYDLSPYTDAGLRKQNTSFSYSFYPGSVCQFAQRKF